MRIIKIQDIKDDSILLSKTVIDGVTFLIYQECLEVVQAANFELCTVEKWFKIIGIKYDSISINGNAILYKVGDKELGLSDLSSGERLILYLLACKVSDKPIVVQSLFERLGNRLEQVVYDNLLDYKSLTVILYNAYIQKAFDPYFVKEI